MICEIPDDYRLQAVERTGYPDGGRTFGNCPHCGQELFGAERLFFRGKELIGCDFCISSITVEDVYDG